MPYNFSLVMIMGIVSMAVLAPSNRVAIAAEPSNKASSAEESKQAARLSNERMILSTDVDAVTGSSIFDSQKGLIRLSPDGKKLLFYREEPTEVNGRKGVYRLVLRNLTDGRETILPFPALPKRFVAYLPMLSLPTAPFDRTSNKIVLGVGIDANKNGIFEPQTEKMQAVVFDTTTSTTTNLSVTASIVTAGYSVDGDRYVVSTLDRESEKAGVHISQVDLINWREFALPGTPRAATPNLDLLMLLKSSEVKMGSRTRELPTALLLFDTKENKKLLELPAFKLHGALSMYVYTFVPQWTRDGNHLCYIDVLGFPEDPRHGTRIWDRSTKTVIKEMVNVVPIGPGPTKSSAILMRVNEVREGGTQTLGIVVHDTSNNRTHEIPLPDTRILGTNRGSIIYAQKDKTGKEAVYMADIALAKDAGPSPE